MSLVGTLEFSEKPLDTNNTDIDFPYVYGHIHISIADSTGTVKGGHLMAGCIVYTTAEIVLMELEDLQFSRQYCKHSTYDELHVAPRAVLGSILVPFLRTLSDALLLPIRQILRPTGMFPWRRV